MSGAEDAWLYYLVEVISDGNGIGKDSLEMSKDKVCAFNITLFFMYNVKVYIEWMNGMISSHFSIYC